MSFSELDFACKNRTTRKEKFLNEMNAVLPWQKWCEIIKPFYYENGNGRQPTPLLIILKMYMLTFWYNLSDEACEDTIYDTMSFKNFIGDHVPDATTLCKFRKMLERNKLNKKIFQQEVQTLKENGLICERGTIVDATIISAPSSNKNKDRKPNPEMSSTFKGKESKFGMKSHIGVDEDSGLIHSTVSTIAKEADVIHAHKCLHGKEKTMRGDSGYLGIEKRPEICEKFQDGTGEMILQGFNIRQKWEKKLIHKKKTDITFIINKRPSTLKTEQEKLQETAKSSTRSKVEHVFLVLKHLFGFRKVRLRTLTANDERLHMYYALVNIYKLCKRGYPQNHIQNMMQMAA